MCFERRLFGSDGGGGGCGGGDSGRGGCAGRASDHDVARDRGHHRGHHGHHDAAPGCVRAGAACAALCVSRSNKLQ